MYKGMAFACATWAIAEQKPVFAPPPPQDAQRPQRGRDGVGVNQLAS